MDGDPNCSMVTEEKPTLLGRLTRQAGYKIKSTSIYVHQSIALGLNIIGILSTKPLNIHSYALEFFAVLIMMSMYIAYKYFYYFKSYEVYDFEQLYAQIKRKSPLQIEEFKQKKIYEPHIYYFEIIQFLADEFPGVHFEYKMRKRDRESASYLAKQDMPLGQRIARSFWKVMRNLKRSIFFWRQPAPGELFITQSESTHLKYIKAEYWQHDDVLWTYFMYLNLPIIVTLFYGGYQVIFVDLLFILFAQKINEVTRAQQFGDKLLKEALFGIQKRSDLKEQRERRERGRIVEKYIKLKQSQQQPPHSQQPSQREEGNNQRQANVSFGGLSCFDPLPAYQGQRNGTIADNGQRNSMISMGSSFSGISQRAATIKNGVVQTPSQDNKKYN